MVASEGTNTNDAFELAAEQALAEQLDQNTREFIAGLANQFNFKFAEEEIAEVMAAKTEDDEDEEGDERATMKRARTNTMTRGLALAKTTSDFPTRAKLR